MAGEPLVEVRDLWKAYLPGRWVLRGVNLNVMPGEFVAVIGPNGSGKTTLLKIVAGLLRPSKGEVRVCGWEPWSVKAKKCRGVVMHWSFLYDELTVEENLQLYATLTGSKNYQFEDDGVSKKLGLREYRGTLAGWLSFGWRRRADIARALIGKPKLLIIDEPFTGLDSAAARVLAEILRAYVSSGGAVLAASPRTGEPLDSLTTRVYEVREGKLVER